MTGAMSFISPWLFGSFNSRSWPDLLLAAPLIVVGIFFVTMVGGQIDRLTLGDDVAQTLGVRVRLIYFFSVAGSLA